jgi:hypothetical protein
MLTAFSTSGPPTLAMYNLKYLLSLRCQPAIAQVQMNAAGFDRSMVDLGLYHLQTSLNLAQPCQASMPQLMTGRIR